MRTLYADSDEYEIVDEPGTPMLRDLVSYWDAKRAGRLLLEFMRHYVGITDQKHQEAIAQLVRLLAER